MNISATDRFSRKVVKHASGCWNWTATLRNGYGRFWDGNALVSAHRFSYEQVNGKPSEELDLDHLCRNRACVNPDHLEPVTRKENIRRGVGVGAVAAGIQRVKTACPSGHQYDGSNTYTDRVGRRYCRKCHRVSDRARKLRRLTGNEHPERLEPEGL